MKRLIVLMLLLASCSKEPMSEVKMEWSSNQVCRISYSIDNLDSSMLACHHWVIYPVEDWASVSMTGSAGDSWLTMTMLVIKDGGMEIINDSIAPRTTKQIKP